MTAEPGEPVGAVGERPGMPRALTVLLTTVIAVASLAALMWPRLSAAPAAPPDAGAVGVIFGDKTDGTTARVGGAAPDFQWVDSEGHIRALTLLHGRPVVLNFWATWCVPCRTEMPVFERVAKAHPEVTFLAIDLQEEGERVRTFFDSLGLETLEPLLDTSGAVTRRYGVVSLPSTVFVDPAGVVRQSNIGGPVSEDQIVAGLLKAGTASR